MAEPTEPESTPPIDPTAPEPAESAAAEDLDYESGPPIDPDIRTGFSFEQRRFLWTLTGINIVAVLLGAAIIVGYLATARSQDAAVVRLGDASDSASTDFRRAESRDMQQMAEAKLENNSDAYNAARQDLIDAFTTRQEAVVAYRRARGLDAPEPTPEQFENFTKELDTDVAARVAAFKASTQPASQPATKP